MSHCKPFHFAEMLVSSKLAPVERVVKQLKSELQSANKAIAASKKTLDQVNEAIKHTAKGTRKATQPESKAS
jgi:hypothetical protein